MVRFLKKETVYIPKEELEKNGIHLPDVLFEEIKPYGPAVSEDRFNAFLLEHPEYSGKCDFELTRVQSLSCRMSLIQSIRPLKKMFLYGLTEEKKAEKRIEQEEDAEREKLVSKICTPGKALSAGYLPDVLTEENRKKAEDIISSHGLSIQYMTEIGESGKPCLLCFVTGKGLFFEIYPDDWTLEDFERFEIRNDGSIVIPEPSEYEDVTVFPDPFGRDFQNHTLSENIHWCLTSLSIGSEAMDYVDYRKDGISFSFKLALLAKLINPDAFQEQYFIDGIVRFSETTVVPQNPGKQPS